MFNFWGFEFTSLKIIKHQELTGLDRIWDLLRWKMVDISPDCFFTHTLFFLFVMWLKGTGHLIRLKRELGMYLMVLQHGIYIIFAKPSISERSSKLQSIVLKGPAILSNRDLGFYFVLLSYHSHIRATERETWTAIRNRRSITTLFCYLTWWHLHR